MSEPNVTAIPGILLRTVARTIARTVFVLAAVLFIGGIALTFLALILCTWRTARPTRVQAGTDLLTSVVAFAKTVKP